MKVQYILVAMVALLLPAYILYDISYYGISDEWEKLESFTANNKLLGLMIEGKSYYLGKTKGSKKIIVKASERIKTVGVEAKPSFCLAPNGEKAFVGFGNTLIAINLITNKKEQSIDLVQNLKGGWSQNSNIYSLIKAYDDFLYFSVNTKQDNKPVYIWKFDNNSITPTEFYYNDLLSAYPLLKNGGYERLLHFTDTGIKPITENLSYSSQKKAKWANWADLNPVNGILLSFYDPPEKSCKHIYLLSPTGNLKKLCKGSYAVWGDKDNIYFIRNLSELWCYSMTEKKESLIFRPYQKYGKSDSPTYISPPVISKDKQFLAFPYENTKLSNSNVMPSSGQSHQSYPVIDVLILDLKNKKYGFIENADRIYATNFRRRMVLQWVNSAGGPDSGLPPSGRVAQAEEPENDQQGE